jgi:serine/threonine-protein kinase RIO1
MGIATARPLALLERRWGPIRRRAYFITAHVAGEPLAAIVARHRDDPDRLAACAERLVQLLERLRRLRLSHGDFKASNLIWTEEALYLLDLDGMRKHARWPGFQRAFRKDVQRLLANWPQETAFGSLLKARLKEIAPHV